MTNPEIFTKFLTLGVVGALLTLIGLTFFIYNIVLSARRGYITDDAGLGLFLTTFLSLVGAALATSGFAYAFTAGGA